MKKLTTFLLALTISLTALSQTSISTAGGITGAGTIGYLPRFVAVKRVGNSAIFQSGSNIGIGTLSPSAKLNIKGVDLTSSNFALTVDNSANTSLLSVRNDGLVSSKEGYWINNNLMLSNKAATDHVGNIIVGSQDNVGGNNLTALGRNSAFGNTGDFVVTIGNSCAVNNIGSNDVGFGTEAISGNTGNSVIAIGFRSAFSNTGNNAFIVGNSAGSFNNQSNVILLGASSSGGGVGFLDMFIGTGINRTNETIHHVNLRQGTANVGELNKDMSAAPFNIIGAVGTGTGLGGDIIFKVSPSTTIGSTQNPLIDVLKISQNGNVGIGTANPTSKLQVAGLPTYANNAAALAASLTIGAFYIRSGHGLDVVQ